MAEFNNKDDERETKPSIVLLGRTGVGKATVANQIAGEKLFNIGTSLEGVTRPVRPTKEEEKTDKKGNRFKAIDIVGPYGQSIKFDKLKTKIKEFAKSSRVNLFLFVIRKGAYTDEEIKAFANIIENFAAQIDIREICALVITGCENLGKDAKQKQVQEIKTLEDTKAIAAFMGKGIHPVGFPDLDNVKDVLKEAYSKGITHDSDELRKLASDTVVQPGEIIASKKAENKEIIEVLSRDDSHIGREKKKDPKNDQNVLRKKLSWCKHKVAPE